MSDFSSSSESGAESDTAEEKLVKLRRLRERQRRNAALKNSSGFAKVVRHGGYGMHRPVVASGKTVAAGAKAPAKGPTKPPPQAMAPSEESNSMSKEVIPSQLPSTSRKDSSREDKRTRKSRKKKRQEMSSSDESSEEKMPPPGVDYEKIRLENRKETEKRQRMWMVVGSSSDSDDAEPVKKSEPIDVPINSPQVQDTAKAEDRDIFAEFWAKKQRESGSGLVFGKKSKGSVPELAAAEARARAKKEEKRHKKHKKRKKEKKHKKSKKKKHRSR